MAFGQNMSSLGDSDETIISETQGYINIDDDVPVQQQTGATGGSGSHSCAESQEKDSTKPLLDEVTFIGPGNSKNAGGAKQWVCNHCKGMFTSSYTRIHAHFFGPPVGKKKSDIKRCSLAGNDRVKYEALLKKVKEAENAGIS
ncbi:hypothetical protein L2E82_42924 [Cichorium intybus]|uniref:Uncharacterized protein n=1 Tax=Cichorium intybus TaxID=13427 RepID=A0ACB8ZMM7_CICIN|nr:hypothetical protein L2E82_42924 [Cichorium intybus]